MLDEIRYRWGLRKYLKDYVLTRDAHASVKDFTRAEGEPDMQRAMEKERAIQESEIAVFTSKYLVRQAYLNSVPVPEDESSWQRSRYSSEQFLSSQAAMQLRMQIRAAQKADWDFWTGRVTLALAVIGSIFGVLAYFKK